MSNGNEQYLNIHCPNDFRLNVYIPLSEFPSALCPWSTRLSSKCPLSKCPSAKCPLSKIPSSKCLLSDYSLSKIYAYFRSWEGFPKEIFSSTSSASVSVSTFPLRCLRYFRFPLSLLLFRCDVSSFRYDFSAIVWNSAIIFFLNSLFGEEFPKPLEAVPLSYLLFLIVKM